MADMKLFFEEIHAIIDSVSVRVSATVLRRICRLKMREWIERRREGMTYKRWNICIGVILVLLALLAFPVYAKGEVLEGLTQTNAEAKSISLAFEKPGEAVQYEIYSSLHGKASFELKKSIHTKSEKVNVTVPISAQGKYYDFQVIAYDEDGNQVAKEVISRCAALPGGITGIKQQSLYTSRRMKLSWNRQETASGYQVETYLYSTKTRKTYGVRSVYGTVPMEQDQLYRVRIRAYVDIKVNGKSKRLYGAYGAVYTSLQPRLTFDGREETSVEVTWTPVEGADSYAVFVSRNQKSGYQRVKITQSPSAVLENLKPNTRYYVLVRVNKRVKGVLYRSPATYVYPVRIDTKGTAGNTNPGFELM